MQAGLSAPDGAVLAVVVDLGSATPGNVAEVLGWSEDEAAGRLEGLVDGGWLAFWPQAAVDDPPRVTLTPWGAERLGVRLDHRSSRWVPVRQPPSALRVRPKRRTIQESAYNAGHGHWYSALELVVDPCQHEPWVAVAQAEEIGRALARGDYSGVYGQERLPFPAMFLGLSSPWNDLGRVSRLRRRPICRACGGGGLWPHEYCLRCDTWGFDPVRSQPRRRGQKPSRAGGTQAQGPGPPEAGT